MNQQNARKGGGLCIFANHSVSCQIRRDLDIFDENNECLNIEINNKLNKNMFSVVYRPPSSDANTFLNSMNKIFHHAQKTNKHIYLTGDLNINVTDYDCNKKVRYFIDYIFQNNTVTVLNRPTRVTRTIVTAIDHILTLL